MTLHDNLRHYADALAKEAQQHTSVRVERREDNGATLVALIQLPALDCEIEFHAWGFAVRVGARLQHLRFDKIDASRLTPFDDDLRYKMRHTAPLELYDFSFGPNMSGWSKLHAPGIVAVYLRQLISEAVRLKTAFTPWTKFQS